MSITIIQAENQRRAMLKLLASQSDLSSTDYELHQAVEVAEGLRMTKDKFNTELDWLKEQNLVTLEGQVINTVTLTQRGLDIAQYKANQTGVAKKRPNA